MFGCPPVVGLVEELEQARSYVHGQPHDDTFGDSTDLKTAGLVTRLYIHIM